MTNITKAAKQALAALETCRIRSVTEWEVTDVTPKNVTQAIDALRAALQDKAGEVRIPAAGPSNFEQRFAEAVRLLTHASPPADMVASWLARTSEDLQHWVGSQKGTPEWAQSLAITDAAHTMAISPVEGEQHYFEPPGAPPAPVVPDDVARYRAIRKGLVYIEPHESGEIYVAGETGVYTKSGDEFDAAIDAIAASRQKQTIFEPCCDKEDRTLSGGCRNCGDPCF